MAELPNSETVTETAAVETPGSTEAQPTEGAFNTLLSTITDGDRQKYTTVEDALKSITPAQTHIKSLEDENKQLKETLAKAESLEKLVAKLEEKAQQKADQPQSANFDESKLDQMLSSKLSQMEQQKSAKSNVDSVVKAFTDKFGDKAGEAYNKVAEEAGVDGDTLKSLAEKSPLAVLRLAGLTGSTSQPAPAKTQGSIRTESFSNSSALPSAVVKMTGYTTEDLTNAWRATDALIKNRV